MVFGQILKNLIEKNHQVWIPQVGLLAADAVTSKLKLDPYGAGGDGELIALISDIHQVQINDAKNILIKEVAGLKKTIRSEGKYIIEGIGEITEFEGEYQFVEKKKDLFPTDFFNSSFNPETFARPVIVEPIIQVKPASIKVEEPKIIEPEIVEEVPIKKTAKKTAKTVLLEEVIEEKMIEIPETKLEEPIEPIELVKTPANKKTVFLEEIQKEEEIVKEEIIEEVKPRFEITEPRLNIGNARYDEGFYQYDQNAITQSNGKWKLVAGIAIGLMCLGFIGPWLAASFQRKSFLGMAPLWKIEAKKDEVKPLIVKKIDTTRIDSTKIVVKAPALDTSIKKAIAEAPKMTPIVPAVKTPVSKITPTAPKASIPVKSITKSSTSDKVIEPKKIAKAEKTIKTEKSAIVKDSGSVVSKSALKTKVVKENVLGKPYATANYYKGNHYLSFGKYKLPSTAANLRKDLKSKAGVETDIIVLDGVYHVVIPYTSKTHADKARSEYPNTVLFQ